MTTTSSTPSTSSDPDELCQICETSRADHGDRLHKFSADGQLIPLDPPPKPRQNPPAERGITDRIKAESFATLIEVLTEKGILDAKDVIRIFMGRG